jgi:hypothetical protein
MLAAATVSLPGGKARPMKEACADALVPDLSIQELRA